MEFELGVLGGTIVRRGDGVGEMQRGHSARLLAALAVDRGRSVRDDVLLERLWPAAHHTTRSPRCAMLWLGSAGRSVRRASNEPGRDTGWVTSGGPPISTCSTNLSARPERWPTMVRPRPRSRSLDEALALVRGRPFEDVADEPWAMPAVEAITERIALAHEHWAGLRIAEGQASREIARLRAAAAAQPHREVRWCQLVEALSSDGRRTEALRAADEGASGARGVRRRARRRPAGRRTSSDRRHARLRTPGTGRQVPIRRGPIVGRALALADVLGGCESRGSTAKQAWGRPGCWPSWPTERPHSARRSPTWHASSPKHRPANSLLRSSASCDALRAAARTSPMT